ncbi:MAG TPA: hypothetical protein VN841_12860 [Bryobacteraceae bacterium]|nr:hypothetical protein [Bryobacteraceae bacterium]
MNDEFPLSFWLALWIAGAAAVFFLRWKRRATSVGLVYAFLFILWLLHWVGAAFYLREWPGASPLPVVLAGLRESTYAVLAFAAGSLLLAPVLLRLFRTRQNVEITHQPHRDLPLAYLVTGCGAYVAGSVLGRLPSMAAASSVSEQFLIVAICLRLRQAWLQRDTPRILIWSVATFLLPFFTIFTQGFLGFGAMASFTILCFLSNSVRSLWRFTASAVILGMLFLSLYVSYMRDRKAIRDSVWGGESWEERTDRVTTMLRNLEWFNPLNDDHARRIDGRLNQDYLVGRSVEFLEGRDNFANGETIRDALLALVPRIIWPDKPVSAGSGRLVARFTGLRFAEGTSVGIGQVMEWYANFGSAGVWVWFLLVGGILGIVDAQAGRHLRNGNWQAFTIWYLPAMSLLNIGGSMVEVSASAGAALIVAVFLNRVILYQLQQRRQRARAELVPSVSVT